MKLMILSALLFSCCASSQEQENKSNPTPVGQTLNQPPPHNPCRVEVVPDTGVMIICGTGERQTKALVKHGEKGLEGVAGRNGGRGSAGVQGKDGKDGESPDNVFTKYCKHLPNHTNRTMEISLFGLIDGHLGYYGQFDHSGQCGQEEEGICNCDECYGLTDVSDEIKHFHN